MWLLIAFVGVPVIEIALFMQVGGAIGLFPTLLIVIATAILGTYLVRSQGLATLRDLQGQFSTLNDPTETLAHGAMILFAGALLLTPGFFTDAIGFALLTPPIRLAVFHWARTRIKVQSFHMGGQTHTTHPFGQDDIIDAEYQDISPDNRENSTDPRISRH